MSENQLNENQSGNSCSTKKNVKKSFRFKRVLLWVSFFVFLFLLLSSILVPMIQNSVLKNNGPLGELYEINGRKMHLYCSGEGNHTVVLNADILGGTLSWSKLQSELEKTTRVCSYDRAGIAWSDTNDADETLFTMADDLNVLLAEAGENGPYILIGHGFGGDVNRAFMETYPEAIEAFVLLDSQARDVMETFFPEDLVNLEKHSQLIYQEYKNNELLAQLGLFYFFPLSNLDYLNLADYPEHLQKLWKATMDADYWKTALKEWRILHDSKNQLKNEPLFLGDKAIYLLAADYLEEEWPLIADIDMKNLYDIQLMAQEELLRLSYNNKLLVLNGVGHNIPALAADQLLNSLLGLLKQLDADAVEANEDGGNDDLVEIGI